MLPDTVAKNSHNYVYRILTNASKEYTSTVVIRRAFRAIAVVANNGKSVIVPKVAIFGNLWEATFANFWQILWMPESTRNVPYKSMPVYSSVSNTLVREL